MPQKPSSPDVQSQKFSTFVQHLNISDPTIGRKQLHEKLISLESYLSRNNDTGRDPADRDTVVALRQQIAKTTLPSQAFAENSPYSAEQKPKLTSETIAKEHALYALGLSLLSHLHQITPLSQSESVDFYTCLASFSDTKDSWTSSKAQEQAIFLIDKYIDPGLLPDLLHDLLQKRIKPLFSKTKNPAITQQGRRAIDPVPNATNHSDLDVESKPWKYHDVYIVTVFQWVLIHLDQKTTESNWPLLLPPLLTLLDDTSTTHKSTGCNLLTLFLANCPSPLLARTGLGEVFENAVMPCLMYLPSLTEEAESLQMLKAAYPALMALVAVRFGDGKGGERGRALDRIFRYGVLKGYAIAGEQVRVAEVLVEQITVLVREMGVKSMKDLKHIIPLLSKILAAPFATAYPPLLHASLEALLAVIVTDWPRISYHRGEILRGLAVCWCRIEEQEVISTELQGVEKGIRHTVRLLTSVLKRDVDVEEEYQVLIDSDDRLRGLLTI